MEPEISLPHESSGFPRVITEAIALLGCYATRFVVWYRRFRNQIFKDHTNPGYRSLAISIKRKEYSLHIRPFWNVSPCSRVFKMQKLDALENTKRWMTLVWSFNG